MGDSAMREPLLDTDGENRAVRSFLMHYGAAGLSVGQMKTNLRMSGWNGYWPAWCDEPGEDKQHLTKAGAQLWLRHLFALESADGAQASAPVYGSTDLTDGIAITGLTLTDGDKRLIALVTTALGVRHPAMDDLVILLMAARSRGVAPCDAVQAWQHEEDPARVISAIQKAQALRDGGASASSVKPYSVPLAHGVAPSDGAKHG